MDKERVNRSTTARTSVYRLGFHATNRLALETLVFRVTRRFSRSLSVQADNRGLHPPYLGALERIYLTRHLAVRESIRALSGGAAAFPNHFRGSCGTVRPPLRLWEPFLTNDSK